MPSCFHQNYHLSCIASASRLTHPASACSEQVHTLSWLSVPGNLSAHSLLWRTLRCFTNTESGWMHLGTSISCSSSTISASRCTRVFSVWLEVHPGMWVSLLLLYQANVSLQSLHSFSNHIFFLLQGKYTNAIICIFTNLWYIICSLYPEPHNLALDMQRPVFL